MTMVEPAPTPRPRSFSPFGACPDRLLRLADEFVPFVQDLIPRVPQIAVTARELLSAIRALAGTVHVGVPVGRDLDEVDRRMLLRLIALAVLALAAGPAPAATGYAPPAPRGGPIEP
jgi:hypothetical protein